jgi:hypothetical protein
VEQRRTGHQHQDDVGQPAVRQAVQARPSVKPPKARAQFVPFARTTPRIPRPPNSSVRIQLLLSQHSAGRVEGDLAATTADATIDRCGLE